MESLPSLAHLDENSSDDDYTASTHAAPPRATDNDTRPVQESTESYKEKPAVLAPHVGHKKVLVTGGAGFVGSNVAEALMARGDSVVIVDEMNDYYDVRIKEGNLRRLIELAADRGMEIKTYRGDICDESFMLDLFEKERPMWICHMAARAGVRPSIQDPYVYIHSNIRGTTHLFELAHKFGVKVCLSLLNLEMILCVYEHCPFLSTHYSNRITSSLFFRTLSLHPLAVSMAVQKAPSSPRKKMSTIPSHLMPPPKRLVNYWPIPTIISTVSTSQDYASSPSTDHGDDLTWHPLNSLIVSVEDWNCNNSAMGLRQEITPTLVILSMVSYVLLTDPTPIKCSTLARDQELV